jgi:hypothetical protein
MRGGQLNRVEHAQDLVEIAAGAHGVAEGELDLLIGTNDEDGADGGVVGRCAAFAGFARLGREHVIELGDLELGVADHGIVDGVALGLFDVRRPLGVIRNGIDAEANDLGVALLEFRGETGHIAQLRGAHGSEVLGMREQDGPAVANPFVEVNRAASCFRGEIGGSVVDAQGHFSFSVESWGVDL